MPEIGIILGSDSDLPKVKGCFEILDDFGVSFEVIVSSAHRTPAETKNWAETAADRGMKAIIAVAGGAAHLPGVVAAHTILPVIGVPIETKLAGGLDSILSILQMPGGIPVATMPVGSAGGTNAGLFAVSLLAVGNQTYSEKLTAYRRKQSDKVKSRNAKLQELGYKKYIDQME